MALLITLMPVASISLVASASLSVSRPHITTVAPSRANCRALALPSPLAPPGTRITLSLKRSARKTESASVDSLGWFILRKLSVCLWSCFALVFYFWTHRRPWAVMDQTVPAKSAQAHDVPAMERAGNAGHGCMNECLPTPPKSALTLICRLASVGRPDIPSPVPLQC